MAGPGEYLPDVTEGITSKGRFFFTLALSIKKSWIPVDKPSIYSIMRMGGLIVRG